ncbi:MAG: hypothetical protein U1F41_14195 [Burkholderiales bacterium]
MIAFLRRTIFGGALVVLVFGTIGYFLWHAITGAVGKLARIPAMLSVDSAFPALTGLAALLLLVLVLGLLLQVPPVRRAMEGCFAWLGARFPFSRLLHGFELELVGLGKSPVRSAVVTLGNHEVLAFVMEELADGSFVVFAPGAPNPSKGSVYIVPREGVRLIDASHLQVAACISNWGAGARTIVDRR